jgi:hypothetical protein
MRHLSGFLSDCPAYDQIPDAGGCGVHVPLGGVSLFQVVAFGDWGVQMPVEGVCALHDAGAIAADAQG